MPEHEARRISEISYPILASRNPVISLENINLHKDGRQVILETGGVPIFDKNGNFSGYRGIDRDITERKKTEEILRQKERELEIKTTNLETEIAERRRAEKSLREINETLEQRVAVRTKNLEEINTALNVLLKKRADDKTKLEEKVLLNIRRVVEPYLEKLRLSGLDKRQKALADILESNLKEIISSFAYNLSSMHLNMTPKELKIANLIRQGRTSKEICEILGSSEKVVAFHRQNIRRKLGLLNKKVNLTSYLRQKFQ
jgi:DNA-binding CsgD family transcriptional regulator/PAS domain-containing protein